MVNINNTEKDPTVGQLLEKNHIYVENSEDKEDEGNEEKKQEVWKQVENIGEDLNKEKEIINTQQNIKEELSTFSLITRTELLINKFRKIEREAKTLNNTRESKWEEWIQKAQAKVQIKELENIKKILERYQRKWDNLSTDSLDRYNQQLQDKEEKLSQFEEQRDKIIFNETWWATVYDIKVNTYKDALKLKNNINKIRKSLQRIDDVLRSAELSNEIRQELGELKEYLTWAINNPNDPLKPYILNHREDIKKLNVIDEEIYQLIKKNVDPSPQVVIKGTRERWVTYVWVPLESKNWSLVKPIVNYNNLDEAWKKWWVMWMVDYGFSKTNMTWQQRQFWQWAWNLALIWWWVFLGRKAISSILWFDKNKWKDRRKWLGWIAWGTLLLQWAMWKNPIQAIKELFNGWEVPQRISGLFGGWKGWSNTWAEITSNTPEESIIYVHGFSWLPWIFWWMKVDDMKNELKQEWGTTKIKDYKTLADTLRSSWNKDSAQMVETLEKTGDKYNVIWLTLDAMWLDRDTIQKWWTEEFDQYAISATKNIKELNDFMQEKGYGWINIEKNRTNIKSFIACWRPPLAKLEDEWIFIKDNEIKDNVIEDKDWRINKFNIEKEDTLWLKNTVDTFTTIDQPEKNILIAAGNLLYDDTKNNVVEFKEDSNKIYLKTYWEWTPIDVSAKTIDWLKNDSSKIYFDWAMELINAANLTNYIKHLFRWKYDGNVPENWEYFAKSGILYNIKNFTPLNWLWDLIYTMTEWDKTKKWYDPERYWWPTDTEVIDAWWFWDIKRISPTLNKYIWEYADYLNKLDMRTVSRKDKYLPN